MREIETQPHREENVMWGHRERVSQGRQHTKTEAGAGVIHLPAEAVNHHWPVPGARTERHGTEASQSLPEKPAVPTP